MEKEELGTALANVFSELGFSRDLIPLANGLLVDDSASVFFVGSAAKRGALLLSPINFPNIVSEGAARARAMRNHLGSELGSAILDPLADGRLEGRSYVILPYRKPLAGNRLFWRMQRRSIKPALLKWLQAVAARHSVNAIGYHAHFADWLDHLRSFPDMDPKVSNVAATALEKLHGGLLCPRFVPMHNDLWKGNILLANKSESEPAHPYPFFIIDWRGSRIEGFPFFDLIRLSMSFALTASELREQFITMSQSVGCDLSDVQSYLAVALGELSTRLENFPLARFLDLTNSCFSELKRASLF